MYYKKYTYLNNILGLIEYVSLCAEQLESALDVMRNAFFLHENVCRAVGLPDDIEGQKELEDLCINTAQDGVSIIAIDRSTGKVVGTAFNKLQVREIYKAPPILNIFV